MSSRNSDVSQILWDEDVVTLVAASVTERDDSMLIDINLLTLSSVIMQHDRAHLGMSKYPA